jgi:hypothetical protein
LNTLRDELNIDKWDIVYSNPPFGVMKMENPWMNFQGKRDIMAMEIALRYGKRGCFIVPPTSSPFVLGSTPYKEYKEQLPRDLKRFCELNKEFTFDFNCPSIDTSLYNKEWKNLSSISTEVIDIWMDDWIDVNDTMIKRLGL